MRRFRGGVLQAPSRSHALLLAVALLPASLAVGCGGGSRQDAHESSGSFEMKLAHASFSTHQAVARPAVLELQVSNPGSHTVPDVAVTIDSFDYNSNYPELAASKRPIWAIERGPGAVSGPPVESQEVSIPGGAETAYVNTWALGALASGKTQKFLWRVVPVKAGTYTVHYSVAAGLAGKSQVKLAGGAPARGQFTVAIAAAPADTHVDPSSGRVVAGAFPAIP